MTEKQYKIISDNLGEYSVLRPNGSIVITEIQYKVEAELFCDELNELNDENKELKEILKHTYETHECETCKHNQYFNWLDPATMKREYDSKCGKGLHDCEEVHGCEEYELDLEMFKKRVKR